MKKIVTLFICLLLCGCNYKNDKCVDINSINNFNYDELDSFDFDLHSNEYLLVRMSDLSVLYAKNEDLKMYPASLTKLMTLDTVLYLEKDLNNYSSISYSQLIDLINDDASLAGLKTDYEYTLNELLYALILPSGGDAAVALENYFSNQGINLIEEMNKRLKDLNCTNTNFVNTTGLHDNNHYSTLNDLFKIIMDVLSYPEGRKILETTSYKMSDGNSLHSSTHFIRSKDTTVLGGKTGYTTESGQSVIILYRNNNRSYILMLANAMGNPYDKQYWHFSDAMEILNNLY